MALDDELLNTVTWKIPNALALVGSRAGDERNAMTASWVSQLSMQPVLIGVGVDITSVTHRLIRDGGSFTVNLWSADDTRVFVKFSKPAVDDGTTLNGRPVHRRPRPARPSSTRPSPGSTAGSARRSTSAPTRCSSARWSMPPSPTTNSGRPARRTPG